MGYWAIRQQEIAIRQQEKYNRSRWLEEIERREEIDSKNDFDGETEGQSLPSIIEHFKSLELSCQTYL